MRSFELSPSACWVCRCGAANLQPRKVCRCGQEKASNGPGTAEVTPARVSPRVGAERAAKPKRTGAEMRFAKRLADEVLAGKIALVMEQVNLPLRSGGTYRADFLAWDFSARVTVYEIKGAHLGKHLAWSERGVEKFKRAKLDLAPLPCEGWEWTGKEWRRFDD